MNDHYPPLSLPATPDDVLAVIRDAHRHQCAYDPEANSDVTLSRESTIDEWREACDLVDWRALARALNGYWTVEIPIDEWRNALRPSDARTLGGVCDLLARHARTFRVRPARLLGAECLPAGAFLTIRSYLAAAGADVREVAPSTALAEYARRYPGVFLGQVSRLAPGALPTVKIRTPLYHGCMGVMMVFAVIALVGYGIGVPQLGAMPAVIAVAAYVGIWVAARCVAPASVEFEGVRTFRDLAVVVARSSRAGAAGVR